MCLQLRSSKLLGLMLYRRDLKGVLIVKFIDDFLGAIGYALLIGLEYIKMAWTRWQNI